MIRRILVPLDGSVRAETVLLHVATLARIFNARVDLLHVIPANRETWHDSVPDPLRTRLARAERERYLARIAKRLKTGGIDVRTRVAESGPAEVVVDLLRREPYDLVALTTHGSGDDRHLHVGCTATAILLYSGASTLLVPTPVEPPSNGDTPYHRIVAPVDCSPRGDWSLRIAATIANQTHAALKAVHVLDDLPLLRRRPFSEASDDVAARVRRTNHTEAARYLEEVVRNLGLPDLPVEQEVLDSPRGPASALQALASAEATDLIVLTGRGRGPSTDPWPLGGTATKLLLGAACPTLLLQDSRHGRRWTREPERAAWMAPWVGHAPGAAESHRPSDHPRG